MQIDPMDKYYGQSFGNVYAWAADAEIVMKFRRGNQLAIIVSDDLEDLHVSFSLNNEVPFCTEMLKPVLLALRGTPICPHCKKIGVKLLCNGWQCKRCGQQGDDATPVRINRPETPETVQLLGRKFNRPYIKWNL